MNDLSEIRSNANSIIKNHMIWSMGAGLIPVPIADFFAVSAIQLDMVRQLCTLYEIDYKETEGKAMITAVTGSALSRLGARAIKFIPGVGSVIGGVTLAVLSGASTYALGEVFKKHFETGGTFLDFDPSRLKKMYDELFEKGKQYAREIRQEHSDKARAAEKVQEMNEDDVTRLSKLAKLREDDLITEEEFNVLKDRIINSK